MTNSKEKLKFFYFPFLSISIISILSYSFINYFVLQKLHWFNEGLGDFILPSILFSLAWIIFYKSRAKLVFAKLDDNFKVFGLISILTVPSLIIIQSALSDLQIKRHKISYLEKINNSSGKHIFELDSIVFDTTNQGVYSIRYKTPHKNRVDDLHFDVYCVAELILPASNKNYLWFGESYNKTISGDLSDLESQEKRLQEFEDESFHQFKKKIARKQIRKLELNTKTGNYEKFILASNNATNANYGYSKIILTNEEKLTSQSTKWTFAIVTFIIGQLVWFGISVNTNASSYSMDKYNSLDEEQKKEKFIEDAKDSFEFFIPRKNYWITPVLLNLNIFIFLLMSFSGISMSVPNGGDLIKWGSCFSPLVKHGQWWRLITSGFLHFGFIHLMMNMLALGFSGFFLEPVIGTKRMAVLYFSSVLFSSICSLWWHPFVNSAGASGGIFGLFGAMLLYALFEITDSDQTAMFMIVFFFFGFFTLLFGFAGLNNVDNAGHVGGLIAGAVISIFFIPTARKAKGFDDY